MWSQSPEIPGRCSVVSGAGAGIKGPFLQKVFQFLQPLYHMICFMRSSHIFQFRLFHLLPAKPAGLHPCCLSACDISSQGIPHDHAFFCSDPRKLFQTALEKTYIRLIHANLLRHKTMLEIFQHIGFFHPADLLLIMAVAGRAQDILSL